MKFGYVLIILKSLKSLKPYGIYINTVGPSTSTIAAKHLDKKTKPDNQINKTLKLKVVSVLVERRELTAMRGGREGGRRKGWVASSASSSGGRLRGRVRVQGDPTLPNPRTKGCWSHCALNKGGWLVYGLGKGLSDGRRPATQVNSFVKPKRAFRLENKRRIILQHE